MATIPRKDMVACNFCEIVFTAPKPKQKGYPENAKTLGDFIRIERMDRGLKQKEIATTLGVSIATLGLWELNKAQPMKVNLPSIIEFLGYIPPIIKGNIARLNNPLFKHRSKHGLTIREVAEQLGIDRETIHAYENNTRPISKRVCTIIKKLIDNH